GDGQARGGQGGQLGGDHVVVERAPHPRPADPRPEVRAEPQRPAVEVAVRTIDHDVTIPRTGGPAAGGVWRRGPPPPQPRAAAGAAGRVTVADSPPPSRGARVSRPSWARAMLSTMARPRPTPLWSPRWRPPPRWNGSTSVAT